MLQLLGFLFCELLGVRGEAPEAGAFWGGWPGPCPVREDGDGAELLPVCILCPAAVLHPVD